jgi:hypothetical protein
MGLWLNCTGWKYGTPIPGYVSVIFFPIDFLSQQSWTLKQYYRSQFESVVKPKSASPAGA